MVLRIPRRRSMLSPLRLETCPARKFRAQLEKADIVLGPNDEPSLRRSRSETALAKHGFPAASNLTRP